MKLPPTASVRWPRPSFAWLALAALALVGARAAAVQAPLGPVAPLAIQGTNLVIDRPVDWQPGGVVGYGILISLIGRGEGYPNFSVMTDPELTANLEATTAEIERQIEELSAVLVADKKAGETIEAGWIPVNGLRAHSSLTTWSSVTGRLRARRLIVQIDGKPFIFTWAERDELFPAIEALVEHCVRSLRLASRPAVGGDA